jgi:hypothetical protein
VHTHIDRHIFSLSHLFLFLLFLPKLLSEMDGRNTQCARILLHAAVAAAIMHLPIMIYRVEQRGVVGIAQCAVHTMPTTDANTTCPTQNNPLSLSLYINIERDRGMKEDSCAQCCYIYTHTHAHTHTCVCVCVCMCIYMRMRVSPPPPPLVGAG